MKQTEQFQLSQWDSTDRIKMEDFNTDNAKIEAALNKKLELAVIMDKTVTVSDAASYSITFDGIQPCDCFAIFIELISFPTTTTFTLHAGSCATSLCSKFYTKMAFMGFPLRNPDSYIILLPISRATEISPLTNDHFSAMNALTFKTATRDNMTGTFHIRVTAIL